MASGAGDAYFGAVQFLNTRHHVSTRIPKDRMRSCPFILLALFVSMAACGQSPPAAPWVEFYQRGQVVVSVDTSRMSRAGQVQELWLRFDAQPNEVSGKPGTTYTRTEQLNRIDCAGDSVKALRMLMWDPAGTLVDETTREDRWRKMSEHVFGRNGIYPALCRWLARRE